MLSRPEASPFLTNTIHHAIYACPGMSVSQRFAGSVLMITLFQRYGSVSNPKSISGFTDR